MAPIRRGDGTGIGSIRLGDGTEVSEVRTGDGQTVFSAGDIPDSQDLLIHLKPEYLDNNFSNGDTLTEWVGDVNGGFSVGQSPNNNGSTPTVETGVLNGFAAANLPGSAHLTSDSYGGTTPAFGKNTAYTQMFVAVRQSGGVLQNLWAPDDADDSEWNRNSPYPYFPRSPDVNFFGGHHGWSDEPSFDAGLSPGDFSDGVAFIWTHRYNGNDNYNIRVDAVPQASDTNSNYGQFSVQGYHVIGTAIQNPNHQSDIYFVEGLMWDKRLSDTKTQEAELILSDKYGLSI